MKHKHSISKQKDGNEVPPYAEDSYMTAACSSGLSALYIDALSAALFAHAKLLELHEMRMERHITNKRIKNCAHELGAIINVLKRYS